MPRNKYLIVAEKIIEKIEHGDLRIGSQLPTEIDLMEKYGVSRSTIREAIKYLSAEGIVTVQQGRGTFVTNTIEIGSRNFELSNMGVQEKLNQLLEARLLIEPQIALCAVQKATEEDIWLLQQNIEQMDLIEPDSPEAVKLDVRFHQLVAECTKNDVFIKLIPMICSTVQQTERLMKDVTVSSNSAREAHKMIVKAIRDRDALNARYYMEHHIKDTIEFMK